MTGRISITNHTIDAFAGICMFSTAWLADKYRIRGPIIAGNAIVTIIGLAMMGWAPGIPAQYAGVFFTCAGAGRRITFAGSGSAHFVARRSWLSEGLAVSLVAWCSGLFFLSPEVNTDMARSVLITCTENKTSQATSQVSGLA
jgi:hypothetical protein